MVVRRLGFRLLLVVLAALAGILVHAPRAGAGDFIVGVDEDSARWGLTDRVTSIARGLGLKAIRVAVPWHAGWTRVSDRDQQLLQRTVVGSWGLRVVVSVYGTAAETPRTDEARSQFCGYVADLLARNPSVADVVIWNDANDGTFWRPQSGPDGSAIAPAEYELLLAQCWTAAHAVRPTVNVIAPSASLNGSVPNGTDPVVWWRKIGEAYRSSGRTMPILDTVGHVPHPLNSAERPWSRHTRTGNLGEGDYARLVQALTDAFTDTSQPVPGQGTARIWYLGQGFQTTPDAAKSRLYTGKETDRSALPAWSSAAASDRRTGPAPDQATQLVDAIRVAYCQPKISAFFNFHLVDEPNLAGWQSGLLWADLSPKPSYAAFRRVVSDVNTRNMNCTTFSRAGAPPRPAAIPPTVELQISGLRVTSASSNSASVSWRTTAATQARIAYGVPGSGPTLWKTVGGSGLAHEATLGGLAWGTSYRVWIAASADDGQQDTATVDLHTSAVPRTAPASIRPGGPMLLGGQPFFPMFVWSQCPDGYAANIAAGINLFADNPCGGLQTQLDSLGGRALSAAVAGKDAGAGPGLVGFFYPDEPDGLGMSAAQFPARPSGPSSQVGFLTLTNHFYSGAAPLPWAVDYPAMIAKSDMVGFDLYPLQEWCRPERLGDVYAAQQELVRLAAPRPTFQWIEAADWSRCPGGATAVTPATVRAESWLAIAGGAYGLGFFPASWSPSVGAAIAGVSHDVAKLGPALSAPPVGATTDMPSVKLGARTFGGAVYVIAVNASYSPVQATIRVGGLGGRTLSVLDEGRDVVATDGAFADSFAPLGVHIYIAAPA